MLAYNVCIKENPQVVHFPPPPTLHRSPPQKKHNINNPDALLIISA